MEIIIPDIWNNKWKVSWGNVLFSSWGLFNSLFMDYRKNRAKVHRNAVKIQIAVLGILLWILLSWWGKRVLMKSEFP